MVMCKNLKHLTLWLGLSLIDKIGTLLHALHCFDTVGWVTGSASDL